MPIEPAADGSTGPRRDAPVGVVLAGGASRRLGFDKALVEIPLNGVEVSLPALAAKRLAAVCAEVAVADRGRRLVPGLPSLPDGPGGGPAAGILGAAEAYPGRSLLVLACDLPRIPTSLLAELTRHEGFDWVVPRWNDRLEPLCAFYGPAALTALAGRVEQGLLALHGLREVASLAIGYLAEDQLARFGPPQEIFFNLNTPEDLEKC